MTPPSAAQAGKHKVMQELFEKTEWSNAEHRAVLEPEAPSGTAACAFYILFVSGEGAGVAF